MKRNNEQGNWMVGGGWEGMHNRLRNKERESFRRCPIQGYIFLWEEVARDKTWNYLNVARTGGIVTRRQRENSITPVPRVVLMKYTSSRILW